MTEAYPVGGVRTPQGKYGGALADVRPDDRAALVVTLSMGDTAEDVATLDGITRAESDAFALRSHERAIAAIDAGRFDGEIVPVGQGVAMLVERP